MFRSTVTDTAESDPDKGALVDVVAVPVPLDQSV